jgi:hypothetical protein
MNLRAMLVTVAALPACVSSRDCAPAVPAEVRADVIRYVLDREMVDPSLLSQDDLALGLGAGRPYSELDDASRAKLFRWAAGYADCINDRVERIDN